MDGLNEPKEPKKIVKPEHWKEFLKEFSLRNNNRRARFNVFRADGAYNEEDEEAHLEDVRLNDDGEEKNIEVIRIVRAHTDAAKIKDEITNVRGLAVQYDVDGSEDALEITDEQNSLVMLRFESKVDGVS